MNGGWSSYRCEQHSQPNDPPNDPPNDTSYHQMHKLGDILDLGHTIDGLFCVVDMIHFKINDVRYRIKPDGTLERNDNWTEVHVNAL